MEWWAPKRCVVLLAVVLAALCAGCGSTESPRDESMGGELTDGAVAWEVVSVKLPHTIVVAAEVDYCARGPVPTLDPIVTYQGEKVIITIPSSGDLAGGRPMSGGPEKDDRGTSDEVCAGVTASVRRAVSIDRELDRVEVLDGGFRPPALRWPE